ncbi:uncharacterized protein LOC126680005 [Mercurialis annua]|uniref:uncharacterized protein LOC126680005 n=1 Tax=Mercurialis annua TaxID=3986 RepID=UPI0021601CD2|nr:uncharacterized protein LOC126680005 [Mercurialis annua]XP_050230988.1 uncharacterized protein LOC126680005 [Mercurialis annua]
MATSVDDEVEVTTTERYLRWPKAMDELLLELLKEEKVKGNKDEKQFNKVAWGNVVVALNAEFQKIGKKIDKAKVVNRLKTITRLMNYAIELLDKQSGFCWNDITKKIEAVPNVWDSVIKVKSEYCLVRDKELYFLDAARELFEKDRANRKSAATAKEKVCKWQAEPKSNVEDIDEMQINDDILLIQQDSLNRSVPKSPTRDSNSSANQPSEQPSKGVKQRRIASDIIANELREVASSMKEIARAITITSRRIYTANEITTELKKLRLGKWKVMECLDFLKDNEHLVERFFACDDDIKLAWLRKKMELHNLS